MVSKLGNDFLDSVKRSQEKLAKATKKPSKAKTAKPKAKTLAPAKEKE
jgi:hypothetical protein